MSMLGIVILLILHVLLAIVLLPYGIAVPLVLPLVYLVAAIGFMATYAAFPIIQKYMIEPYDAENSLAENSDTDTVDEQ